jgi:uncharacterized protein (TIGR00266 family)
MAEIVSGNAPDFADAEGAGVGHRVIGSVLPVLEIALQNGQSVISNGGELSWMSANIQLTTSTSGAGQSGVFGVLKRAVAGGTIFMTQYTASGPGGTVAFATKMPGQIFPIRVSPQQEYLASQHGFMAATGGVTLSIGFQQKLGAGIFGGAGFILEKLTGDGVAWIELSGELVEYDLPAGEQIFVHPGHVGLFEAQLGFEITMVKGIRNIFFGADTLFLAKLTGPGKVWLQTMTLPGLAQALSHYLPQNEGAGGIGGLGGGGGAAAAILGRLTQ